MRSNHTILFSNSQHMTEVEDESIDVVITSPPYPMINMWDEIFGEQNPAILKTLKDGNGNDAFELMHQQLDSVWNEVQRVTKPGAIVCINVGDATRTINGDFRLYSNHSRILGYFRKLGFSNLPGILWRKQTNAPNKFMGSGMLPAGAYITLEHEHILILRKGERRRFTSAQESRNRSKSAFFWEERNMWFSDLWDLKGTKQKMVNGGSRDRSGAFPFELAYRLVNMFSVKGDWVLDPFLGTGTTTIASIASGRNSIGYEIDKNLLQTVTPIFTDKLIRDLNSYINKRILDHLDFVKEKTEKKGPDAFKYVNAHYNFPVTTRQEREIILNFIEQISVVDSTQIRANYYTHPVMDIANTQQVLFARAV